MIRAVMVGLALVAAATAAPASAQALSVQGSSLFQQRCSACHAVKPGVRSMGPNLAGVAGRRSGRASGYAYSKALAGGKINWDAASLDAFLAAPAKKAPGTKMMIGVPNAADRKAIVTYLGTLKGS